MSNNDRAAGKVFQPFFQRPQGVDIEVVGWFVEEQNIGFFAQHLGQMNAVAFATGEHPDFFLLVGTGEVETRYISAGIDRNSAHLDNVLTIADLFPDGFVSIQFPALIDITQSHRFAHLEFAAVGLFFADNHFEQG